MAWLVLLPVALLRAGTLAESDTFWQIRTGLLTIQERSIPSVDPFSWTAHGQPWTLNSWGFNVAIAEFYRMAGLPGAALACASLVAAAYGLILFLARRMGAVPVVTGTLLVLTSPILISWFSARPQLADYVAVLMLVLLLRRIVEGQRPFWSLLATGILMTIWVNLHAGVLLGVSITGAATALVFSRRNTRNRGSWCLGALLITVACSLANPYGLGLVMQTALVKGASTGVMTEWQPLDPAAPIQLTMFALGLVALCIAVRSRDIVLTAALSVAVIGSVTAIRLLPILLILALPVLSAFASKEVILKYLRSRRIVLVPGAAVGVALVAGMAALSLNHIGRPDPAQYPNAAIQAIPPGCRLFNSMQLGGLVLLERPDILVSLDSRNDLYGSQRVLASERVMEGQVGVKDGLAGAGCVLVPPNSVLVHRLMGNPGWELKVEEKTAVLFVRR